MKAYLYLGNGRLCLTQKPKPTLENERDAIVKVTLASICTSDLHIKYGFVPRAEKGIAIGHEAVGVVEEVGAAVRNVKRGDRVSINVETFCGNCFFCKHGFVNNCTDKNGGWALGCRIDGMQAEYVRVPFADTGLTKIPDGVSDEQALFVGDILATGYWAAKIGGIAEGDTALVIGAGPTGICTLLCALLKKPAHVVVCEKDEARRAFVKKYCPQAIVATPENITETLRGVTDRGGADVVFEVAGTKETFRMAWECARPNATVVIVAMYEEAQSLPLPEMYGKNLTFKTGGVDGCDGGEILRLIEGGFIDTAPLITHTFPFSEIDKAYDVFENKRGGGMKVAVVI